MRKLSATSFAKVSPALYRLIKFLFDVTDVSIVISSGDMDADVPEEVEYEEVLICISADQIEGVIHHDEGLLRQTR